jgi:hypothetical protein
LIHVGILLGLFFNPEDGGDTFLQNIGRPFFKIGKSLTMSHSLLLVYLIMTIAKLYLGRSKYIKTCDLENSANVEWVQVHTYSCAFCPRGRA